jgi:small-conductance mechanosensitive channel
MRQLAWPTFAFVAASLLALLLRAILLMLVRRWSGPDGRGALARAIRLPSVLWSIVFGIWVGNEVARQTDQLPPRVSHQISVLLEIAVILSVTITVSNIFTTLVQTASERRALGGAVTGLGQSVARGVVFITGLLVLLSALGIQIAPILTALGVGGLAVALALQDTLSNLFAGVHLLADKPIRVGDYVKVADNVEGHVVDIGWRSTRVRMLQNVVVTIPNKRVAESTITNYDMPESRLAVPIRIAVDYGADAELVERILLEESTRAVDEVPGLLGEPAPSARLIPGFGEYSLDFTLAVYVKSFTDQFVVQHELRKRVLTRLAAEGVRIPVQVRGVELRAVGGDGPGRS